MALNDSPIRADTNAYGSIDVELSNRQLPVRMRVGSMRSSLRVTRPQVGLASRTRILAVPVAMALRFLSRDSGRINLTLS